MIETLKSQIEAKDHEIDEITADVNINFYSKIAKLSKDTEEETEKIENLDHKLFFLNSQISNIETFFQDNKREQKKSLQQEMDQKKQVFEKFTEATDRKMRITFQNFFLMKQQELIVQANKLSSVKMNVSSVCIFYLYKENPFAYVKHQQKKPDKFGEDKFQLPFYCQTFSIKKNTQIKEIFIQGCHFWNLKESNHTLADNSFNSLDVLIQNPVLAESFFTAQKDNCPYAYFFLWEKKIYVSYILNEQQASVRLSPDNDKKADAQDENLVKMNHEVTQLLIIKPGLVLYAKEDEDNSDDGGQILEDKENQQQSKKFKDTGRIGIITRFVIMTLNIVLLSFLMSTGLGVYDYQKITYLKQSFTNYIVQRAKITDMNDIYEKMKYLTFIDRENGKEVLRFQFFTMIGPIRFLQKRSQNYNCDQQAINVNRSECIYSVFAGINELSTNLPNLVNSTSPVENWQVFRDSQFTQVDDYQGLISLYDGSGYVYDVDSYRFVDAEIDDLNQKGLINVKSTQVVALDMRFFDINRGLIISVDYLFEITTCNQVYQDLKMKIYRYNLPGDSDPIDKMEVSLLSIGIFISLLIIYLDVTESRGLLEIKWKKELKRVTFSYKEHYSEVISFVVLYNTSIMVLLIISFVLNFAHPALPLQQILQELQQVDIMSYGNSSENALKIKAALVIMVAFNVVVQIKISKSLVLIMLMFTRSMKQIGTIVIFMFFLILSYSVVYFMTFGQKIQEFNYYSRSIISFFDIFLLGEQELWSECQIMYPMLNSIFTAIVFVTINYGAVLLINAVIQETYRLISYRNDDVSEVQMNYDQLEFSYHTLKSTIQQKIDLLTKKKKK